MGFQFWLPIPLTTSFESQTSRPPRTLLAATRRAGLVCMGDSNATGTTQKFLQTELPTAKMPFFLPHFSG